MSIKVPGAQEGHCQFPLFLLDTHACSQACEEEGLEVEVLSTASFLQPAQVTRAVAKGRCIAARSPRAPVLIIHFNLTVLAAGCLWALLCEVGVLLRTTSVSAHYPHLTALCFSLIPQ